VADVPLPVLDLVPVSSGSDVAGAVRNTVDLARRTENSATTATGSPNTTSTRASPARPHRFSSPSSPEPPNASGSAEYARQLEAAGVPVLVTRYQGAVHDFVSLSALRDIPAARKAIQQGGAFLRDALRDRRPGEDQVLGRRSVDESDAKSSGTT
jgi:hypothetical protein